MRTYYGRSRGFWRYKLLMSKVTNFAPSRERILLRRRLRRFRDAVLVPTSPGYLIFWPAMVMQVLLRSNF